MGWNKLDQAQLRATLTDVKESLGSIPVVERPDWTISLESRASHYFIHVTVHLKWTSARAKQFAQDIDAVCSAVGGPIFVLVHPDDIKLKKFANKFRFQHLTTLPIEEEPREVEVFVRL